jgi:PAS domain S-box-containing protein
MGKNYFKKWFLRGVGLILPLAALAIQWIFWSSIQPFVWFLFYPAVFFSAWIDGLRGAIAATVLSALLVVYFFMPSQLSFIIDNPRSLYSVGVFVIMGGLFGFTMEKLKKAKTIALTSLEATRVANDQLEIRVRERTSDIEKAILSLQASEHKLRSIMEDSADAIFLVDSQGKYTFTNKAVTNLLGFTGKEMLDKTILDIAPSEKSGEYFGMFQSLLKEGKLKAEIELQKKDGSLIPVDLNAVLLTDGTIYGSCRDISGRKREQLELMKHRDNLEELVNSRTTELQTLMNETSDLYENAPCGYHSLDKDGRFVRINNTELKWLGYDRDEVIGKLYFTDLLTPGGIKLFQKYFTEFKQTGSFNNLEFEIIRKDRSTFYISANATAIFDDEKTLIKSRTILFDITERKKLEAQLFKERFLVSTLMNNTTDFVYFKDRESRFIKINKAMAERFGLANPDEAAGKSDYDFFSVSHATEARNDEMHIINTGVNIVKDEMETWPDGRVTWVSTVKSPLLDENGETGGTFGISRDVSELRILMQDLKEAKEKADSANLAKSEFLANMSHEIRTPLNAVLGYSELLNSTKVDSIQQDYVNSIKTSGKSLLTIINDILDLSKIEAGKLEIEYEFLNTYNFFSEFERIFSFKLKEKEISFILEIAADTPNGIYTDEVRLRQIIFNLIGNAIKFTSRGHIKLRVFTENARQIETADNHSSEVADLTIEVTDTGIGISIEKQATIFDPFVQEQKYKQFGGTGLGLSICRRLADLMGGTISLKSELGKGSVFTVKFPSVTCLQIFAPLRTEETIDPDRVTFEKAKILIIDDVPANRSYLADALKETQLMTYEAENGAAGLEKALEIIPNLIITDIRMPVMNGFEFIEKLKDQPELQHIPVLAYSASVLKTQKQKIFQRDFSGLLIKPVKISDLYRELMKFLPFQLDPGRHSASATEIPGNDEIFDSVSLVSFLESELTETWKKFSVRQPINDVRLFGNKIIDLGLKHNAKLLIDYGKEIQEATLNFNVESMLRSLKKFTAIVAEIKKITSRNN